MSEGKRVCIVGLRGEMGDWFRRYFLSLPGWSVCGLGRAADGGDKVYDADPGGIAPSERSVEDAIGNSDVVMISVPLATTADVIAKLAPYAGTHQTWCDIASIKRTVYEPDAYRDVRASDIVSLHPVFGGLPREGDVSITGRVVAACPHTGETGLRMLVERFAADGADVIECDWREHDRYMAVVQGLTHAGAIALGATLVSLDVTTRDAARFTSPLFRLLCTICERVLSGSGELYAGIAFANSDNADVLRTYADTLRALADLLDQGEDGRAAYLEHFETARRAIPSGVRRENAETVESIAQLLRNRDKNGPK